MEENTNDLAIVNADEVPPSGVWLDGTKNEEQIFLYLKVDDMNKKRLHNIFFKEKKYLHYPFKSFKKKYFPIDFDLNRNAIRVKTKRIKEGSRQESELGHLLFLLERFLELEFNAAVICETSYT